MEALTDYVVPGILGVTALLALKKGEKGYEILLEGAAEGLQLISRLLPGLVFLLTGVQLLRASGCMALMSRILAPVFSLLGIPAETAPLVLIRPISGSAALAVGAELMKEYGVDSPVGRTVAVMLGSTETTFYTLTVYFGAAGIRKTRYTLPAALTADLVGFCMASLWVRLLF